MVLLFPVFKTLDFIIDVFQTSIIHYIFIISGNISICSTSYRNKFICRKSFVLLSNELFFYSFIIPFQESGFVRIEVYDVLGREVATIVNEEKLPGEYEVEFSAKGGSAFGNVGNR